MPSSKFSKTTATGVRAPLNTQAPLTFFGMLSAAERWDQSSHAGSCRASETLQPLQPARDLVPTSQCPAHQPSHCLGWLIPIGLSHAAPPLGLAFEDDSHPAHL